MKKIIKKKNRIINNNKSLDSHKIGIIFINHNNKIISSNKSILINNTKILLKNNSIILYKNNNIDDLILKLKIKNIIYKIRIYNKYNLELYILVIKNKLPNYTSISYIDLYNNTDENDNIYYSILQFNKKNNNYLSNIIYSNDKTINIAIKEIYYYLIGYI
jgi:hypothetical protein